MPSPRVSLYRLTLPPVIGVPSASQAAVRPSTTWENCHMISGFSGLPKFRQLVAATGVAPVQETFLAASATACMAPSLGSSQHQRPLSSSAMASAREVPLMRISPASAPGPSTVLVCTMESYCSHTHRLEQMLGADSKRLNCAVRLSVVVNCTLAGLVRETGAVHGDIGRLYKGASSVSAVLGMSATRLPCSNTRRRPPLITRPMMTASSPHFSKTLKISCSRPLSATSGLP